MGSEAAVITELVAALEKATLMAKQLPNTTQPSHVHEIYATLHSTHHRLTMFLAHQPTPSFPQPSLDADEPMQVGGGDDDEDDEIQWNKRPKRPLSPSSTATLEQARSSEDVSVRGNCVPGLDPQGTSKLRALDLIYGFRL